MDILQNKYNKVITVYYYTMYMYIVERLKSINHHKAQYKQSLHNINSHLYNFQKKICLSKVYSVD